MQRPPSTEFRYLPLQSLAWKYRVIVIIACLFPGLSACGSDSVEQCAVVLKWQGRVYDSDLYHYKPEGVDPKWLKPIDRGALKGEARQISCEEDDGPGATVDIYAIRSVPVRDALVTGDGALVIRKYGRIPQVLLAPKTSASRSKPSESPAR